MIDPTVTGKMFTGRNPKRHKEIGDVSVTLTRNTETLDVNGDRFSFPRVEYRLRIEVKRDGKTVAFAQIPAGKITDGMEEFMSQEWMWERDHSLG